MVDVVEEVPGVGVVGNCKCSGSVSSVVALEVLFVVKGVCFKPVLLLLGFGRVLVVGVPWDPGDLGEVGGGSDDGLLDVTP